MNFFTFSMSPSNIIKFICISNFFIFFNLDIFAISAGSESSGSPGQGGCPTPGCTGVGHIKGAKYSAHHRYMNSFGINVLEGAMCRNIKQFCLLYISYCQLRMCVCRIFCGALTSSHTCMFAVYRLS